MKINEIKTYVMDSPGRDYVFIKIQIRRRHPRLG